MRNNLRQARGQRSQEEVAKAIGITQRGYGQIEQGKSNPKWETAQKLEQYFGIPASELLKKEEYPDAKPTSP